MVLCWTAAAPASAFWSLDEQTNIGNEDGIVYDEDSQQKQGHHSPTVDDPVEYGVDVSFPIHYDKVSDNYPWLSHNTDPENVKTPRRYKDKVVQPLGDRQAFYDDFLESCVEHFGPRGERCRQNERERIAMSLRQPQSMTVSKAPERDRDRKCVCVLVNRHMQPCLRRYCCCCCCGFDRVDNECEPIRIATTSAVVPQPYKFANANQYELGFTSPIRLASSSSHSTLFPTELHRCRLQEDPRPREGVEAHQGLLGEEQGQDKGRAMGCWKHIHQQLG